MARLQVFLAALWWGSLCCVGFMVVPLLFVHLETPAIAGQMAAKLFTAQSWLSLVCGLLLLLAAQRQSRDTTNTPSPWVIGGMLCALLIEMVVKPHIVARDNMALWHNFGSALYVAQWLCATKVLWALCPVKFEPAESADSAQND
ncbi:DUF4149 domain-containing protein [Limnohabitans sp.]|uniref:DUF4149 domain-containing protein n=1 Tax=Limnohabitans sp. TaxID=1907725 RepID=UPI00286F02DE|nr:DUF4149 domain-containing protein [Limnohabitans sp.]